MNRLIKIPKVFSTFLIPLLFWNSGSASGQSNDEKLLFNYINEERLRQELGPLVWDGNSVCKMGCYVVVLIFE